MSPTPYYADDTVTLHRGDALNVLRTMPDGLVNCVVTSPPYYFVRDYGEPGQYGLEATPGAYIEQLRQVFAETRRVLAADGTLWLNLGDVYSQRKAVRRSSHQEGLHGARGTRPSWVESRAAGLARMSNENLIDGRAVTEKSMMMLPERLAIAMERDGWILRNKIVWAKLSCTPDPAPDRLSSKWELLYMFSRSARYRFNQGVPEAAAGDVWRLPASSGADLHTASYPVDLPGRCVRLATNPGDVVLDPVCGSGTTGAAAVTAGRRFVGIDLSAKYLDLALKTRFAQGVLPLGA